VINNGTVSDNFTYFSGAGLYLKNTTTTLTNSTISGNSATNYGNAVYTNNSNIILRNSTVFNNTAATSSATVFYVAVGSSARLLNTIMANGTAPDCFVSSDSFFTDVGGNLVQNDANDCSIFSIKGQAPKLGSLQDNGGDTFTHALLSDSPAINAGLSNGNCQLTDQRGEPRDDGKCDIGAYEREQMSMFVIPLKSGKTVIFGL